MAHVPGKTRSTFPRGPDNLRPSNKTSRGFEARADRKRPGTAAGIVFGTLEDETGTANLMVRPHIYEKYRSTAHGSAALIAEGSVERQGEVVHVQVTRMKDMSKSLARLRTISRDFH